MFDDQDEAADVFGLLVDAALIIVFVLFCFWLSSFAAGWFFGGTV